MGQQDGVWVHCNVHVLLCVEVIATPVEQQDGVWVHSNVRVLLCVQVIATPTGQSEGVWVHTLVPAGNGLWRLPSIDQITDLKVEPADIVKTLDHANVKIVGAKVFYKFDDM